MKLTNCKNSFRSAWMALLCGAMLCTACEKDEPSAACDIAWFIVNDKAWDIDGTNITGAYHSKTSLVPRIILSPFATVNPPSGINQDFFTAQGVTYTVTAEDGVTTKTYTVKAILQGITGDCTWTLTGTPDNYTLTISGNGAMEYYKSGFHYSYKIKTVIIQDGVTTIGYSAFSRCHSLTAVTIGNSVQTIGACAFEDCIGLTAVTIPNSVQTIDYWAFGNCTGLTAVTIPNSVTTIGYSAFYNCSNLTTVTIPNSVQTIGHSTFFNCSSLTSVTIGSSVQTIGSGAFEDCTGLTTVTIPNSVTTINDWAFSGCSNLTTMTIGNSVTTIGSGAFRNCSHLTTVINLSSAPQDIYGGIFYDVNLNAATLKVPASAVDAYKAAPVWNEFGKIEAISENDE
ncbi:MAG: leucine-rich repeat protein [Bacteroidales bacterium]|jgi:hypothetical protein|nr:leucine-rich repeat protein [Bacteroidales bacterium]